MAVHRNRSWLLVAVLLTATSALSAGCSSTGTVSSTGTSVAGSASAGTTSGAAGSTATSSSVAGQGTDPNVGGGSGPTTETSVPDTTIPDPNTSLPEPEPTTIPTIPATGDDPALINCGTVYRASGWPTTFAQNPQAFSCLADAFAAGTPARLVDREQTDGNGGAILVTTYDVLGPGSLRMTVDATDAADRPQVVTVSMCTGVTAEMQRVLVTGCTVVSG